MRIAFATALFVGCIADTAAAQTALRRTREYADVLGNVAFSVESQPVRTAYVIAVAIPTGGEDTVRVETAFSERQVRAWTTGAHRTLFQRVSPQDGETVDIESPHLQSASGAFWFVRHVGRKLTSFYFQDRVTGKTIHVLGMDDTAAELVKALDQAVARYPK